MVEVTPSFSDVAEAIATAKMVPNLVVVKTIDSTNRLAKQAAQSIYAGEGTPKPTWFIGYGQTAGRGRQGRSWESAAGTGMYATLLLPLPGIADPAHLMSLPLAVGVSACGALRLFSGANQIGLKWPNDVVADGRKLAGILIEVVEGRSDHRCAIIGIGVNHSQRWGSLPHDQATSLFILAETAGVELPSLSSCVSNLCSRLFEDLRSNRSLEQTLRDYERCSVHSIGDRLTWTSSSGTVEGIFEGFDSLGCILLRTAEGSIQISAGDILLSHPSPAAGGNDQS